MKIEQEELQEELEDYYLAAEVLERIYKGEESIYSSKSVREILYFE